eukprot:COSAG05_NODE_14698_length_390_cov_0.670103_1_plen_32_part_10
MRLRREDMHAAWPVLHRPSSPRRAPFTFALEG